MQDFLTKLDAISLPEWFDLVILVALAITNLVAFLMMRQDKRLAMQQRWRVPEAKLLGWCAAFGAAGGLSGMLTYRHKIRKPLFYILVPLMLLLQVAALIIYAIYLRG